MKVLAESILLRSVSEVRPVVSATPIANLRARENTRKQIAALVGLAPLNRNSGQTRGHLTIREPTNQTGETEVADRIFVCVLCVSFNARI